MNLFFSCAQVRNVERSQTGGSGKVCWSRWWRVLVKNLDLKFHWCFLENKHTPHHCSHHWLQRVWPWAGTMSHVKCLWCRVQCWWDFNFSSGLRFVFFLIVNFVSQDGVEGLLPLFQHGVHLLWEPQLHWWWPHLPVAVHGLWWQLGVREHCRWQLL